MVSGSGCTSCRSPACARRERSSGRGQSPAPPCAGEKGGAEAGSKHHLLVDATGIPLAWALTGGNRHDVTQLIPFVERVPPVRGKVAGQGGVRNASERRSRLRLRQPSP